MFLDEISIREVLSHVGQSMMSLNELDIFGICSQESIQESILFLPQSTTLDLLSISSNYLTEAPLLTELLLQTGMTTKVRHVRIKLQRIIKDVEFNWMAQSEGGNK